MRGTKTVFMINHLHPPGIRRIFYLDSLERGFKEKTLSKESFVSASQEATFEFHHWFTRYFIHEYSNNIFKNFMIKVRYFLDRLTKNF